MIDGFVKNLDLIAWLGLKGKPKAIRKPHGRTLTQGPHGEQIECDTLQCCHCGGHWEVVIGSGRLRGWCKCCQAATCGGPDCWVCVPYERQLENVEAGRPKLTPISPSIVVP